MTKSTLNPPRAGTKLATLVEDLQKSKTIAELGLNLSWQPHTVRAALTRLRARGYRIERLAGQADTPTRYRLKKAARRKAP